MILTPYRIDCTDTGQIDLELLEKNWKKLLLETVEMQNLSAGQKTTSMRPLHRQILRRALHHGRRQDFIKRGQEKEI